MIGINEHGNPEIVCRGPDQWCEADVKRLALIDEAAMTVEQRSTPGEMREMVAKARAQLTQRFVWGVFESNPELKNVPGIEPMLCEIFNRWAAAEPSNSVMPFEPLSPHKVEAIWSEMRV